MKTVQIAFQVLVMLIFPYLAQRSKHWGKLGNFLSPVVLCYIFGMILSNFNLIQTPITFRETCSQFSIALALPLLLYASDLGFVYRNLKVFLLSFALAIFAATIATGTIAYVFFSHIPQIDQAAGMLLAVYVGGTVNLFATGYGLGATADFIGLVNAADIVVGGTYLLILTSVGPKLVALVLHRKPSSTYTHTIGEEAEPTPAPGMILACLASSVVILGISVGLSFLIFGNLKNSAFLILCLTTISIAASRLEWIKMLKGSFQVGEYLLLMFCVGLGLLADLEQLVGGGFSIVLLTISTILGTVGLHLLLAKIFKVDDEAFLVTSTATIFGPPFIPQIAATIGNPKVILPGIAAALMGIMLANYLGIGLGWLINWIL
ncbi:MAG: DUF819 family protein [Haliscomenobacter sp.]|uniref:DUF819 family protein n=1 Tax=Haliscomenobacter sp. TaxID=2717303 RepID=UPI0029B1C5D7|nr:DUF819 family protein [Haliscomenobacter sp.]MDX2070372.1 DUF819 family protein [Haliscomenobacter sp.]